MADSTRFSTNCFRIREEYDELLRALVKALGAPDGVDGAWAPDGHVSLLGDAAGGYRIVGAGIEDGSLSIRAAALGTVKKRLRRFAKVTFLAKDDEGNVPLEELLGPMLQPDTHVTVELMISERNTWRYAMTMRHADGQQARAYSEDIREWLMQRAGHGPTKPVDTPSVTAAETDPPFGSSRLSGRKILVTGGASPLGRCFVLSLARDGARVAFSESTPAAVSEVETAAQAAGLGDRVKGFVANVAQEESVASLVRKVAKVLGGLDGLVNNESTTRDGLLVRARADTGEVTRFPLAGWQQVLDVNLTGAFLCTREFAAHCIETKTRPACVVNMSSISKSGNVGQANFTAAAAALVADTKTWGLELAPHGIRVGAVAPGMYRTPILSGLPQETVERLEAMVPLKRLADPEDIYMAVKFILENESFTARTIEVDGGQVM